jgi:chemotaxis protein CheC
MFNISELNCDQLDFFQELENIGAGHAATALSSMLNESVNIKVPHAQFCEFTQICDFLNGPENLIVAQLVEMSGDLNGFILMVQDEDDARYLSGLMLGDLESSPAEKGNYSELQISALQEIANILTGSYITAISSLTGLYINCSVPNMVIDMAGAVMNLPAIAYGEYGDLVLFLETEYHDNNRSIMGHFFLIPDVDSYQKLLNKMGIA